MIFEFLLLQQSFVVMLIFGGQISWSDGFLKVLNQSVYEGM